MRTQICIELWWLQTLTWYKTRETTLITLHDTVIEANGEMIGQMGMYVFNGSRWSAICWM